jgi:hypothetical protein
MGDTPSLKLRKAMQISGMTHLSLLWGTWFLSLLTCHYHPPQLCQQTQARLYMSDPLTLLTRLNTNVVLTNVVNANVLR